MLSKTLYVNHPFFTDFICGAGAGGITGVMVAPLEYVKVVCQTTKEHDLRSDLMSSSTHRKMIRAIPPFALSFSAVCAIEFSVNDRIKTYHGVAAGISASALSGAAFLTAADHLMFRRHKGESL